MALAAFIVLAVVAIACALGVVLQRSALYSALSLVGVFLATALLYLMLSAPFLAVLQVIVYAGAIMVLFIFVIMLLSVTNEEAGETRGIPSGWKRIAAAVLGGLLAAQFIILALHLVLPPPGPESDLGSVQAVGALLYEHFIFPFEVASILLLVAIVGAVGITRRHGRGLEDHVGGEGGQ